MFILDHYISTVCNPFSLEGSGVGPGRRHDQDHETWMVGIRVK